LPKKAREIGGGERKRNTGRGKREEEVAPTLPKYRRKSYGRGREGKGQGKRVETLEKGEGKGKRREKDVSSIV